MTSHSYAYGVGIVPETVSGTDAGGAMSTITEHTDTIGSVTATSNDSGGLASTRTFDPWGNERSSTTLDAAAGTTPMGFTGQLEDQNGAYHLRARQYDPSTGSFTSQDTVGRGVGQPAMSAYSYADGNPALFTDPSGLWPGEGFVDDVKEVVKKGAEIGAKVSGAEALYKGGKALYDNIQDGCPLGRHDPGKTGPGGCVGGYAWKHKGDIVQLAAAAGCIAVSFGTCTIFVAVGLGFKVWQNGDDYGWGSNEFWKVTTVDGVIAGAGVVGGTFAAVAKSTLPAANLSAAGVSQMNWGIRAANGIMAIPGAAYTGATAKW